MKHSTHSRSMGACLLMGKLVRGQFAWRFFPCMGLFLDPILTGGMLRSCDIACACVACNSDTVLKVYPCLKIAVGIYVPLGRSN